MKRKVKERRPRPERVWDPRNDLSEKQLAAVGAVSFMWNEAEATFDVLLCTCARIPSPIWREYATRVNGIDGKIQIIREATDVLYGIRKESGWLYQAIKNTLDAVADYRKYRDLIAHSRIVDKLEHIGEMALKRGDIQEVLLSAAALNQLYDHIKALTRELYALVTWYQALIDFRLFTTDDKVIPHLAAEQMGARLAAMREGVPGVVGIGPGIAPNKQQTSLEVQFAFSRYQKGQEARQSLKPLPPFPKESRVPEGTEENPETRD